MPKLVRTIEYYTCEFKCGSKAMPKESMITHEKNCFCNPKNKSCRICKNCESSSHTMSCSEFGLYINNHDKKFVYDFEENLVWQYNILPDYYDEILTNEIIENNENRPFPIKNCEMFVLGKKIF